MVKFTPVAMETGQRQVVEFVRTATALRNHMVDGKTYILPRLSRMTILAQIASTLTNRALYMGGKVVL